MPRRLHLVLMFLVASLLPLLALRAQQPATNAAQPNQPTAKEVIKKVEQAEEAAKSSSAVTGRIKDEGLKRSQVMATLSYLTDVIGPRLTGSPNLKRANEWTKERMAGWGLENAHLEPWGPFGTGWSLKRFSVQVVEPQCIPLIACPKAWSPGTDGELVAEVVYFDAKTEADFAKFKGKLKGTIVLTSAPRPVAAHFDAQGTRLTDSQLLTLANAPEPAPRGFGRRSTPKSDSTKKDSDAAKNKDQPKEKAKAQPKDGAAEAKSKNAPSSPASAAEFVRKKLQFLIDEGAAALIDPSFRGDGGTLFVSSASVPSPASSGPDARRPSAWDKDSPRTLPQLVMANEHYNRLVRMIGLGESVRMALDLKVEFHTDDLMAYNTIAEIPGTDLKDEVVMLGGHMDSWHGGTGATDNAAGISVAMEAVRIIKTLDLKPRRTIRIALWTGEEQGLRGSRAYVSKHFGNGDDPAGNGRSSEARSKGRERESESESERDPSESNAEHKAFSAYFNLDNGTGKIRGVYLQGNDAVRGTFARWLEPFRDMGASTLTLSNTGGTDHLSFDGVGLPGFQFIQDEIEYDTRTHHSNQDVYDRAQADDLKQASVIMASFVYNTAMRDEKLPRKPRPRRTPSTTTAGREPAVGATGSPSAPRSTEPPQRNALKAGAARVKITPEHSMWMAGFSARTKPSEGTYQDLFVKALALEDSAGEKLVIVTSDLVAVTPVWRDPVLRKVKERYGLDPSRVLINCSHTHCGPSVGKGADTRADHGYLDGVVDKIVEVIGRALEERAPATLETGHGSATLGVYRRRPLPGKPGRVDPNILPNPLGPTDPDVPVLRVTGEGGAVKAILFLYACHPTTMGGYEFGGDYAGFAQAYVEKEYPGAVAMFVQGCGGDIKPRNVDGAGKFKDGPLAVVEGFGRELAQAVATTLAGPLTPLVGPIHVRSETIDLPVSKVPGREELEERAHANDWHGQWARRSLDTLKAGKTLKSALPEIVHAVAIGDRFTLVGLSGEACVDYALRLKRELGRDVWVAGYCNDVAAYIPSARMIPEGGYEAERSLGGTGLPSPFDPTIEERIVRKAHQLVAAAREGGTAE